MAQQLRPKAKQVVVVSDRSVSGLGTDQQYTDIEKYFPQLKFVFLNSTQYNTAALKNNISEFGDETILIFGVFARDGSNKTYTVSEGAKFLASAAKIPIFKADEAGIGDGILGGCVLSYDSIGLKTAAMVRKILLGEATPKELGYEKGDYSYKFDIKAMGKFNLSKGTFNKIAINPIFINDSPSFYQLHVLKLTDFREAIMENNSTLSVTQRNKLHHFIPAAFLMQLSLRMHISCSHCNGRSSPIKDLLTLFILSLTQRLC